MKIAISAMGDNLESFFAPHFAMCQYFIIYDLETGKYEAVLNTARNETSGRGAKAAEMLLSKEVDQVFTEKIGPRPFSILKQKGIPCYTGINPRIEHIIEAVKAGEVTGPANEATEEPHAGQEEHF